MSVERETSEHAVTLLTLSLTRDDDSPIGQGIINELDRDGLVWLCVWLTTLADTFARAAAASQLVADDAELSDEAVTQMALSLLATFSVEWARRRAADDG